VIVVNRRPRASLLEHSTSGTWRPDFTASAVAAS
jgi:hypothetical protein